MNAKRNPVMFFYKLTVVITGISLCCLVSCNDFLQIDEPDADDIQQAYMHKLQTDITPQQTHHTATTQHLLHHIQVKKLKPCEQHGALMLCFVSIEFTYPASEAQNRKSEQLHTQFYLTQQDDMWQLNTTVHPQ